MDIISSKTQILLNMKFFCTPPVMPFSSFYVLNVVCCCVFVVVWGGVRY